MARQRKLNASVQQSIAKWIEDGNTLETACAVVGIDSHRARKWIRRGAVEAQRLERGLTPKPGEHEFVAFRSAIQVAEAKPKALAVRQLTKAGKEDWRASLAYLERRFPKEWGQRINMHVEEELDAFLKHLEARLPAHVYAEVLRAADGATGEGAPEAASGQPEE